MRPRLGRSDLTAAGTTRASHTGTEASPNGKRRFPEGIVPLLRPEFGLVSRALAGTRLKAVQRTSKERACRPPPPWRPCVSNRRAHSFLMTTRPVVIFTRRYPLELLAPLAPSVDIVMPDDEQGAIGHDEVLQHDGRVAAIINQGELAINAGLLAATPGLRIVANTAIGVNNFAPELMRARGIWGTNTPEAFADATADCALGLLLMLVRKLGEGDRFVRAGRWKTFTPGLWDGVLLRGRTLGIVGYGRIGRAVELRARAFGLNVVHHTRSGADRPGWRSLAALLAESDFVSLHVPLTPETRGLIDAVRMAQMKPGASLINLARGPVVDEAALIAALRSGRLAGAALDVFADEPQVPLALREMENVVLTPHLGGGSHEGRRNAQQACVENVQRVLRGERPIAECIVVEPEAPARS
ncbi:MAG: D-glycerate dehydrogenase [Opitutus sp.]|nr:D-glycerate dehydrogenase [Opitutus sp.]